MSDPVAEKIRERHKARQEKAAERHQEHKQAVESGEKKLVAERTPTGLYYLRWEGGGALPPILKGFFTSIDRVRRIAETKYGAGVLK